MRELSNLKALAEAEANPAARKSTDKFFNELEAALEKLFDADVKALQRSADLINTRLQSDILTNLVKEAGFPMSETRDAKAAAVKLVAAVGALKSAISQMEDELTNLHMGFGTHFDGDFED